MSSGYPILLGDMPRWFSESRVRSTGCLGDTATLETVVRGWFGGYWGNEILACRQCRRVASPFADFFRSPILPVDTPLRFLGNRVRLPGISSSVRLASKALEGVSRCNQYVYP